MRRGVITVYLCIVFLLMVSLLMVLLESARVYSIGTMTERYADMAAEMVFAAYVQPLAERYDLLAVDAGENGDKLGQFKVYLDMNLNSDDKQGGFLNMCAQIQSFKVEGMMSVRDDDWKILKDQIERYKKLTLGADGISALENLITQLRGTKVNERVRDYSGELRQEGQTMDAAAIETEQKKGEQIESETAPDIPDPRPGVGRWIKSGLLNLVMGDRYVSGRSIDISGCSWFTAENKKTKLLDSFEGYEKVLGMLGDQSITEWIRQGIQELETQLMINFYILEKFNCLCGRGGDSKTENSVLEYEMEYILSGHSTDRENLESAVNEIFTLRTLLNLVYLYTSSEKGGVLQNMVQGLSMLSAIPAAGQVIKLLLMVCWAAAEAVVDCAALVNGRKVPLMKNENSWNLTMEELISIAEKGGEAADYIKDGGSGLDYGQYLLILMTGTPAEKKLIRMTQLMECNIRLIKGYEQFSFSECVAAAEFSGTVRISALFWQHPDEQEHAFYVKYGY